LYENFRKQMERLTRVAIPAYGALRPVALLFSTQAATSLPLFQRFANEILPAQAAVIACVQTEQARDNIQLELARQQEEHSLPDNAETLLCPVLAFDEPSSPGGAVFRFYSQRDQLGSAASKLAIYVQQNEAGVLALIYYAFLLSLNDKLHIPEQPVVLEHWTENALREPWLNAMRDQLLVNRYCADSQREFAAEQTTKGLADCLAAFLGRLPKQPPTLRSYPMNADRLYKYVAPIPSLGKLLPACLRKGKDMGLVALLKELYEERADGSPCADHFYEEAFAQTDAREAFSSVWEQKEAFYRHIPVQWLEDRLIPLLAEKYEAARAEYIAAQSKLRQDVMVSLKSNDPDCALEVLAQREELYSNLYGLLTEQWFWGAALQDVRQGYLHSLLARERLQIDGLLVMLNNMLRREPNAITPAGQSQTDWRQGITEFPETYLPTEIEWNKETLQARIYSQCQLECLNHGSLLPTLYGLVCCSNQRERERIQDLVFKKSASGTAKARWLFMDNLPKRFVVVVSLVPIAYYQR